MTKMTYTVPNEWGLMMLLSVLDPFQDKCKCLAGMNMWEICDKCWSKLKEVAP